MTLEQKYHVKSEPANTCPIIDAAINSVTDDFNKIRAENEALREWGDSVAAYVACRQVERDIIREERPWRRLVRWLSRKLEVAYWLGLSEARHVINETTSGLISQNPNDW